MFYSAVQFLLNLFFRPKHSPKIDSHPSCENYNVFSVLIHFYALFHTPMWKEYTFITYLYIPSTPVI